MSYLQEFKHYNPKFYKILEFIFAPLFLLRYSLIHLQGGHIGKAFGYGVVALITFCLWGVTTTVVTVAGYQVIRQSILPEKIPGLHPGTPSTSASIDEYKLLGMINDYRKTQNLGAFSMDDETCKLADLRMKTAFFTNGVNLGDYSHICPKCHSLELAESQHIYDLDNLLNTWQKNESTQRTIKSKNTNVCIVDDHEKVTLIVTGKTSTVAGVNTKTADTTNTKTLVSDPIIDCTMNAKCGGGIRKMKQSECRQATCCQIGTNWYYYPTNIACDQAQSNYNNPNSVTTYPPCTVNYSAGNSYTYQYLTPSECSLYQQRANANFATLPPSTYVPPPTPDAAHQELLNQHAQSCAQAAADWYNQAELFYSTEYHNFSSSHEAVQELERRRLNYQQELYEAGCTQTILH